MCAAEDSEVAQVGVRGGATGCRCACGVKCKGRRQRRPDVELPASEARQIQVSAPCCACCASFRPAQPDARHHAVVEHRFHATSAFAATSPDATTSPSRHLTPFGRHHPHDARLISLSPFTFADATPTPDRPSVVQSRRHVVSSARRPILHAFLQRIACLQAGVRTTRQGGGRMLVVQVG